MSRSTAVRWVLVVAACFGLAVDQHAQTAGTPLSRNEHPRLLMTRADLPAIGARLSAGGEWNADFVVAKNELENQYWAAPINDDLKSVVFSASMAGLIYNLRKANAISGVSFSKTNAEYLAKGRQWLDALILNVQNVDPMRQESHTAIYVWWLYDWLYDSFTPQQKVDLISFWKEANNGGLNGWFFGYDNAVDINVFKRPPEGTALGRNGRQWSDEHASRAFSRYITMALAIYGDNLTLPSGANTDAWATEAMSWYSKAFRHPYDGIVTRENQRGGTDGSNIEGLGTYGFAYNNNWMTTMEWGWRTANQIPKSVHYAASEAGYFPGFMRYIAYMTRPFFGTGPEGRRLVKDIYSNADTRMDDNFNAPMQFGFVRSEMQGVDDDAAALAAWYTQTWADTYERYAIVFSRFLAPKVVPKSPAEINMPTSKAFKPGQWMWRSGFTSQNDSVVNVWGYEFTAFSSAVGNFSIDYMGPAIVQPGASGHDFDTKWFGGATNTLGAPESGRTTLQAPSYYDDFGFHRVYNNRTPDYIQNTTEDWSDRTERFHPIETSEDFGYLWLDRTRSFNGDLISDNVGNSLKVPANSVFRQFMVFPPQTPGTSPLRVIVFDQMTVKSHTPAFEKRNHLYYAGTPTVTGAATSTPGPSRGMSGATGKTTYSGGTPVITATLSAEGTHNKTFVTPFVTTSPYKVVLVNHRRNESGIKFEDPYGRMNDVSTTQPDSNKYVGWYRTEVIPTVSQLSDRFVTAIEVGALNANQSATEQIPGNGFEGVRIGNRIGVVAATSQTAGGSFVIPSPGTYRVAIGRLSSGASRTVTAGGAISSVTLVADGSTAPFTTSGQGTLYLSVVVASPGTGAANTVTIGAAVGGTQPPAPPSGLRIQR